MIWDLSMLLQMFVVYSFLSPDGIPLGEYATIGLAIVFSVDFWVVSSFC